jgi:hypothetical protein
MDLPPWTSTVDCYPLPFPFKLPLPLGGGRVRAPSSLLAPRHSLLVTRYSLNQGASRSSSRQ